MEVLTERSCLVDYRIGVGVVGHRTLRQLQQIVKLQSVKKRIMYFIDCF